MYDVVVLTDERYINPEKRNPYIDNVLLEDQLIIDALVDQGLQVTKIAWSDKHFDWSKTRFALFRTTWDYAEKFEEFSDWLIHVSTRTRLINPYELIVWNLDKHYFFDLKQKKVNLVKTFFIEVGDQRTLAEIHEELGWKKTVLKPAISAAAKNTFQLDGTNLEDHEDRFQKLIKNESMLLQPFQESVTERGEISLMIIGEAFTHAVLKKAKEGDFRVQDDFGGTVHEYIPNQEEIDLAIAAVKACNPEPIYARVDIVNDNEGNPAVSELELVEPELWFRRNEKAAEQLAAGIKNLFH